MMKAKNIGKVMGNGNIVQQFPNSGGQDKIASWLDEHTNICKKTKHWM